MKELQLFYFFPVILISFALVATNKNIYFHYLAAGLSLANTLFKFFQSPCSKVNKLRMLICKWNIDNEAL